MRGGELDRDVRRLNGDQSESKGYEYEKEGEEKYASVCVIWFSQWGSEGLGDSRGPITEPSVVCVVLSV